MKKHFSAIFSLFVPLSIHILIERVLNFALVDTVSENCCTVYCSLLLFDIRRSNLVFHPHLDFVMLYLLFLMFLFCVSSIRVTCVANFVNVPVVVFFQRENSVGAVYEKVLSKATIFCLDCMAIQKTAPKQKFWCSIGSLLKPISCLLPIQGRWVCSPCRGCWWFAHRDRPWDVYEVWWCKRP